MILGDTTTCVYSFLFDNEYIDITHILQFFDMYGLGICIKLNSYVAHMFNVWSLSHNMEVPTPIKQKKSLTRFKYHCYCLGKCKL